MKKLFLFTCLTASALFFNSCSKDDNNSSGNNGGIGGTMSFKIDGVQKTYNVVAASEETNQSWAETHINITGSDGSAENFITFVVIKDQVGDSGWCDSFKSAGVNYNDALDFNITVNSERRVKGAFSGSVQKFEKNTTIEKNITNGTFEVRY